MTKAKSAPAAKPAAENVVAQSGETKLVLQTGETTQATPQKAGEAGPASSLETGKGSLSGASAGGDGDFEGRRGHRDYDTSKGMDYDVQHHSDEGGLEVTRVHAESGDDAANQVLKGAKYRGTSIRGVTPASDPDPNSLGGERDASIMLADAENGAGTIAPALGTEANAEAAKKLREADIKELGE